MQIEKVTAQTCENRKNEIAAMIYNSMNYGSEVPWYSGEEAAVKCDLLKNYIEQGSAISYIALLNHKVEGFIWAYPCDDRGNANRVYISILYVSENMRGKSAGRKLVDAVERESRDKGFEGLWLHTNGDNCNARAFYEKVGFTMERVQYQKKFTDPMNPDMEC